MEIAESGIKLPRGATIRISRRLKLDLSHVSRVVRGKRPGSKKLMREIERERQKAAEKESAVA
jgi:hypothetical protein